MQSYRSLINNTRNFRDLGGYPTTSGSQIAYGRIYRSDHLGNLNKIDRVLFDQLGIKNIVDLRSAQERHYRPDRINHPYLINSHRLEFQTINLDLSRFKSDLLKGKLGDLDLHTSMLELYGRYVTHYQDELSSLFKLLLNPDTYPLLIHCSSGKDRTGFVCAMILSALDIAADTIFADYLLSNQYMRQYVRKTSLYLRIFSLFRAELSKIRPLLECHQVYLQESFDVIQNNFGHVNSYLSTLGIETADKRELHKILCK